MDKQTEKITLATKNNYTK